MAYRYRDREQCGLFPQSVADYVGKQDAVRVYDAFVESLDFKQLGIELDEGDFDAARFEDCREGRGGDAFAQGGNYTTCDKDVFSHRIGQWFRYFSEKPRRVQ